MLTDVSFTGILLLKRIESIYLSIREEYEVNEMSEIIIVLLITCVVLVVYAKIKSVYNANSFTRDCNRAYKTRRSSTIYVRAY